MDTQDEDRAVPGLVLGRLSATDELQAAIAAMPDPIVILRPVRSPGGEVTELIYEGVNPAAAALYRIPLEAIIGHGHRELFPSVSDPSIWGHYVEALDTGAPVSWVNEIDDDDVMGGFRATATAFNGGLLLFLSQDVSDGKGTQTQLREVIDSLLDPHILLEPIRDEAGSIIDFVFADANPAACLYTRAPYEKLIGMRLLTLLPAVSKELFARYVNVVETGEPLRLDGSVAGQELMGGAQELMGGAQRCYDIRAAKTGDGITYRWRDVTHRREAATSSRPMIEASLDPLVAISPEGRITDANKAKVRLTGVPREVLSAEVPSGISAGSDAVAVEAMLEATRGLLWIATASEAAVLAAELIVALGGTTVSAAAGAASEAIPVDVSFGDGHPQLPVAPRLSEARMLLERYLPGFARDAQRAIELADQTSRLAQDASIDALTGLVNKRFLGRALGRLRAEDTVIMIDLDHFKEVNDTLGHPEGDRVLRILGHTLASTLRATDQAGRYGGEEFVVIIADLDAESFLTRLQKAWVEARPYPITFSAGIATAGADPARALAAADRAMYRAKKAGRNQWQRATEWDYR